MGAIILTYAASLTKVLNIQMGDIDVTGGDDTGIEVRLVLGSAEVRLPPVLDQLLVQHLRRNRLPANGSAIGTSMWLFPRREGRAATQPRPGGRMVTSTRPPPRARPVARATPSRLTSRSTIARPSPRHPSEHRSPLGRARRTPLQRLRRQADKRTGGPSTPEVICLLATAGCWRHTYLVTARRFAASLFGGAFLTDPRSPRLP